MLFCCLKIGESENFMAKTKKAKDLEACSKFENCKKHQKALQLGGHSKSQFS